MTHTTRPARFPVSLGVLLISLLTVGAARGQTYLVDFGPTTVGGQPAETLTDAQGNEWSSFSPGQFIRLRDTDGNTSGGSSGTGIGLFATTPVGTNGGTGYGLLDPDPALLGLLAVPTATQDNCFRFDDGTGVPEVLGFELVDLDAELEYSLRFFACRFTDGIRETRYTVTGGDGSQEVTLVTSGIGVGSDGSNGNDSVVVEVNGITPDPLGTIRINLSVVQGQFCYLNAMQITASGGDVLSVAENPSGALTDAGGELAFSASVNSSDPVATTLQWERDGEPLVDGPRVSGSTTGTLTITGAMASDAGAYRLVASIGDLVVATDEAVGAVRGSPMGLADFDNNGSVDFFDLLRFLEGLDAAGP